MNRIQLYLFLELAAMIAALTCLYCGAAGAFGG
jgi:hypothetical protein